MFVEQLSTRISNLVRLGKVSKIYPERHSARVTFEDKGGLVSAEMPVLTLFAGKNKSYGLPDIGDAVVCLMQSNDLQSGGGFIIGSLYTAEVKPSITEQNITRLDFGDGSYIQYDRVRHELKMIFSDSAEMIYDATAHKFQLTFNDKSEIIFDGSLKFSVKGAVEVESQSANVKTSGAVQVESQSTNLKSSGDVVIKGANVRLN